MAEARCIHGVPVTQRCPSCSTWPNSPIQLHVTLVITTGKSFRPVTGYITRS